MGNKNDGTRVLIVDDEEIVREALREFLVEEGFDARTCRTGEEALAVCRAEFVDVVLLDVNLPDMDGIEVLEHVLRLSPETVVMMITAYGSVESAIAAFQRGAHDYLMKPVLLEEVSNKIRRLLAQKELALENQWLRRELNRVWDAGEIIGRSRALQRVLELAKRVAPTSSTVLLTGESGTGKELIARAIHRWSPRSRHPFVPVNCAAIPADLIENQLFGHRRGAFTGADSDHKGILLHANHGTVFLDEIGELPPMPQAKLLRVIEQKEILPVGADAPHTVDTRIIAATNRNLHDDVESGRFREDLYYRLNVVNIHVPPLRERREDIPDLVEFLVAKHARALGKRFSGVTHEAMRVLLACPWKGNVRELDNALQRAMILGDGPLIRRSDLPQDLTPDLNDPVLTDDLSEAVARFERQHILRVLRDSADKREAAARLGVALSSLYRKINELEIREEEYASDQAIAASR